MEGIYYDFATHDFATLAFATGFSETVISPQGDIDLATLFSHVSFAIYIFAIISCTLDC